MNAYTWVIASHNEGKVREIGKWLANFGIDAKSAAAAGLPEPEETGVTFEENALLKATAAAVATGEPCLADDSGVVVPALGGDPGVYTARWAQRDDGLRDWDLAMQRVHDALAKVQAPQKMRAAFVCSLAWVDHGDSYCVRGEAWGTLVWPKRGEKGFGFEPMFMPDGYTKTYGEMGAAQRADINHRAKAFALLQEELGLGKAIG